MAWLEQPVMGTISLIDVLLFISLMIIAIIIGRIVSSLSRRHLDDTVGKRSSKRVARLLNYLILTAAILSGAGTFLHVDISAVVLSLGIVGVAIAFATQQIIQNAVAGILISITKPIQLEDWVEIGMVPSTGICRVRDIRLMSTEVRERGGRIATIPNSQIINGKVINYTRSGFVSLVQNIWIDPKTDLSTIRRIVFEEADIDPRILPVIDESEIEQHHSLFEHSFLARKEQESEIFESLNPIVNVVDIQGAKVKLQIKVWVRDVHKSEEIMSTFLESLKARFEAEGIELKSP